MAYSNPFADLRDDLPFTVAPRVAFDPAKHAVQRFKPAPRPQPANDPWADFAQAHPAVAAWIVAERESFEFAGSLYDAVQQWGSLTPNQLAAAEKCAARSAARVAQQVERQAVQAEQVADFAVEHAEVLVFIQQEAQRGSSFFQSLFDGFKRFGSLTERQLAAAQKIMAERAAKQSAKPVAPVRSSGALAVPTLFDVLQRHAHFYAGDLKISRKNGDSLCWLVWQDAVVGKIEDGQAIVFAKAGEAKPRILELLGEFEANPLAAAVRYGKESGRCCSCGRDLTDPESIERGIGPICAEKFGA